MHISLIHILTLCVALDGSHATMTPAGGDLNSLEGLWSVETMSDDCGIVLTPCAYEKGKRKCRFSDSPLSDVEAKKTLMNKNSCAVHDEYLFRLATSQERTQQTELRRLIRWCEELESSKKRLQYTSEGHDGDEENCCEQEIIAANSACNEYTAAEDQNIAYLLDLFGIDAEKRDEEVDCCDHTFP